MKKRVSNFNGLAGIKLGFRRNEAAELFGSPQLLEDMERGGWLKPVVDRHKLVLFDRGDLLRAWSRIVGGEQPPQRIRN